MPVLDVSLDGFPEHGLLIFVGIQSRYCNYGVMAERAIGLNDAVTDHQRHNCFGDWLGIWHYSHPRFQRIGESKHEAVTGVTLGLGSKDPLPSTPSCAIAPTAALGGLLQSIAVRIGTPEHVVKNYLRVIYDKLGLWNRVELALWYEARRHEQRDTPLPKPPTRQRGPRIG